MFIPPAGFRSTDEIKAVGKNKIRLQSSHLVIDQELVTEAFGSDLNVYLVYYPLRRTMMLAPVSDEVFKSLHKAGQRMLKDRNLRGDKTIALHELLIDNQLDDTDRDLEYDLPPGLGILSVRF